VQPSSTNQTPSSPVSNDQGIVFTLATPQQQPQQHVPESGGKSPLLRQLNDEQEAAAMAVVQQRAASVALSVSSQLNTPQSFDGQAIVVASPASGVIPSTWPSSQILSANDLQVSMGSFNAAQPEPLALVARRRPADLHIPSAARPRTPQTPVATTVAVEVSETAEEREAREMREAIRKVEESEKSLVLDRDRIHLAGVLGAGWFGDVAGGAIMHDQHDAKGQPAIAQILREGCGFAERAAFFEMTKGGKLAGGLNVLRLLGACAEAEPHINVFEACEHGNLRVYVSSQQEPIAQLVDSGLLLKFCLEATRGLAALLDVGVAPHDLAARTCQLAAGLTVRVGDYGLAASAFADDYVPVRGESRPVRWIPPEVLEILAGMSDDDDSDEEVSSQLEQVTKLVSPFRL